MPHSLTTNLIIRTIGCACGLMPFTAPAAESPTPGTTEQISVSSREIPADRFSTVSPIGKNVSANGRFVVFTSPASNLVPHYPTDRSGYQVYIRDRFMGSTRLVSTTPCGTPAIDGVAGSSATISANGRYVAFASFSADLVPNDTNRRDFDIFRHDMRTGKTIRVNVSNSGAQTDQNGFAANTAISDDGNRIAFVSTATNLVPGVTGGTAQVYVRDVRHRTTTLVSVAHDGTPAANVGSLAIISGNGHRVLFYAPSVTGAGLYTTYLRDLETNTTIDVGFSSEGTQANAACSPCDLSRDGHLVLFASTANNLVPNDTNSVTDLFLRNMDTGTTSRVNLGMGGVEANQETPGLASLSADGRILAFMSNATNLVSNDTNGFNDIFVRNIVSSDVQIASIHTDGTPAAASSSSPTLSADGSVVIFSSFDGTLGGYSSTVSQIFARQLAIPSDGGWLHGFAIWMTPFAEPNHG